MTDSEFVTHEPCPSCGSKDNLARYSDGHGHCFGCNYHEASPEDTPKAPPARAVKGLEEGGEHSSLRSRGLTEETCRKWDYRVKRTNSGTLHIANYRGPDGGPVIAQKIRRKDKKFTFTGDSKHVGLYGQWLWRDSGKMLTVTEGEIDALTVSQLFGNKWPVVSVPNGAQGAVKAIKKNLEWIEGFDTVVFLFDMDDPGRAAAEACAEVLTPGKARIAQLPMKDPNEMHTAGKSKEVIDAIWGAKKFRPDGIISGDDVSIEDLMAKTCRGYPTPYPGLNDKLHNIRKGELTLLTAGTGIGKSTIVREIGAHFIKMGLSVGNVFLEESYTKTAQAYIAIDTDTPLGTIRENPEVLMNERYIESFNKMVKNGKTYFYNHFGSLESDNLLSRLNYFASGCGVDFILLDHISIVVSGQESSREGERKDIDILMTRLRQLVEKTGVGVIAIAHLAKKHEGRSHEEGGRVTLNDLRGSASLKQLPDNIIGVERNQQDEEHADVSTIRILKNREFGDTGPCGKVVYVRDTGRLLDYDEDDFQTEEVF